MLRHQEEINTSALSQSAILIEIERFVKNTIEWKGLYRPGWDSRARQQYRHALIELLPRLVAFHRHDHDYSEHIMAFWEACEKSDLLCCGQPTLMLNDVVNGRVNATEVLQELADRVLYFAAATVFRRVASDRRYQQTTKGKRLDTYVLSVLDRYSRTLHLRLDLGYRKDFLVEIADVYRHLDVLLEMVRVRHGLFENLIGYAICVEQGELKGYHLHVSLFLPGHRHQRDGYLVKEVGSLWKGITNGSGVHHSCNADKDYYERKGKRGVGMFFREDDIGRDNVVKTVGYLSDPVKDDQFLRMKPKGRRAFFTGM